MTDIDLKSLAPMPSCRIEGNRIRRYGQKFFKFRTLFFLLFAAGVTAASPARVEGTPLDVPVASYIVKETCSPNVIASKDVDRPLSPASLTKILTCSIAIESGHLDDEVVISKEATLVEPTKAGFRPGDRIQLRDLVKAAMVNSSNDAAFAIAIHLGGTVDSFVAMMNAKARSLGMFNSRFTNPAGFDTGIWAGNQTTARDLVTLTEHAVRYPEFNAIARLDRAVFRELSTGRVYSLKTHNRLLELYPYTVGIKTGFTNHAGKCLVARAIKDRKDLLMVILNARNDRWTFASNMFNQGFGGEGAEQVTMPVYARQDSGIMSTPSARQVALDRQRALESLRLKVASQSASGVRAGSADNRSGHRAVISSRKGRGPARTALSMKRRTAQERRLAMNVPRRPKSGRGTVQMIRGVHVQSKFVTKAKRGSRGGSSAAMKSGKKARGGNRTAMDRNKRGSELSGIMNLRLRSENLLFNALPSSTPLGA